MPTVAFPDDFDLKGVVKEAVGEAIKDVFGEAAELRRLKEKPFLTPNEVQKLYGYTQRTLKEWRKDGKGPHYLQRYKGDFVRYTHEAIKEFMDNRNVDKSAENDTSSV